MTTVEERERERICEISRLIHEAALPVQVLSHLAWPPEVKARFFASGERELPEVRYPAFDPMPSIELVREARRRIAPVTPIDALFERHAQSVELGARMLAARETNAFYALSREIFGEPTDPLRYVRVTSLDMAHQIHRTIGELANVDLSVAVIAEHDAESVAQVLEAGVRAHFGDAAPKVEVVDDLSANALATPDRIRVRRGARFTDRAANELLQHEAYVHVATSLNGRAQTDLPSLGDDHPATTRTQEGLAVLAELISGTLEIERLRRLADRVVAIQMAIEGASFLDVYRWFVGQCGGDRDQAFENTRRVFRGGMLGGGAPFTKDVVYLFGLLQTSTAIRAAFGAGRADCIALCFAGKIDIFDVPALAELAAMGLCKLPRYLPPWLSDPRFLLAFLTISTFRGSIDERPLHDAVHRLLAQAPVVRAAPAAAPALAATERAA